MALIRLLMPRTPARLRIPRGLDNEGPRALGGEALGGAQTDPGAAAVDDGNYVFNFSVHKRFLFSLWFALFVVISTAFGGRTTKRSIHL